MVSFGTILKDLGQLGFASFQTSKTLINRSGNLQILGKYLFSFGADFKVLGKTGGPTSQFQSI